MTEEITLPDSDLLELTAGIVAAYVSNNLLPASDLGSIIANTYTADSKLQAAPAQDLKTPDEYRTKWGLLDMEEMFIPEDL